MGAQLVLTHASGGTAKERQRMQVGGIPLSRFNIVDGDLILVSLASNPV